jgi:hypothetical protein
VMSRFHGAGMEHGLKQPMRLTLPMPPSEPDVRFRA